MRRYTNEEIVQLYDSKNWAALWKIVMPMVKHAVRRCMQHGLDPFYVRDDLMQEAYLAAWKSLPRWNAFESSLQTWVRECVRSAVLDANRREASGMVGGRDSPTVVISMHGEVPDDDSSSNDEQGISDGIEGSLAYDDPPEGLWIPDDERLFADQELAAIPAKYRDMARRLAGLGVPRETQAQYAAAEGVSEGVVEHRLRLLRKIFKGKAGKPANHGISARLVSSAR